MKTIPLDFSVVIPVYKNERDIEELYSKLKVILEPLVNSFEIIFVNDGSPDGSWRKIKDIATKDSRVRGISFSKNYGQHQAIKSGINFVQGRWITVMDCDLQDCPEDIPLMYQYALDYQFDIVIGQRSTRKDNLLTRFWASCFYKIYNQLIDFKYDEKTANFGVYSRKVIDAVKLFQEDSQSFGYLVNIVGFKKGYIPVNHGLRKNGKSSYSFWGKLSLSLDLIISNSNKPMKIIVFFGFIISLLSFLLALYLVIKYFWYGSSVPGWFSLATLLFMQTGIVTFFFGIIGLYVNKVYMASKERPSFIINELTFEQISEK